MKEKLLIIGAGGYGRVIADIAVKTGKYSAIVFLDNDETIKETMGIKVIGRTDDAQKYVADHDIFVAVGDNAAREKIQHGLETIKAEIPALIHPQAVIGGQAVIEAGSAVMAGAVVNSKSVIKKGCIVNTAATVDHDCILDEYVHISPGAHLAGGVRIGKGTWVGIGANISDHISVAGGCKIGAGTAVIKNITEAGTYVGVPARKIGSE